MNKHGILIAITGLAIFFGSPTAIADTDANTNSATTAVMESEQAEGAPKEGMILPFMSPVKGRLLFASKGCVVCHAINGIGGEDAAPLDASTMQAFMDPFDFAAKMWRGASTMIALQEDELGEQINFTGEELANIIAFVHSAAEQKKFTKEDIPPEIQKLIGHSEGEESEKEDHD